MTKWVAHLPMLFEMLWSTAKRLVMFYLTSNSFITSLTSTNSCLLMLSVRVRIKGSIYSFIVYLRFWVTFSSLFRNNIYIMIYIFWKIEIFSFQNWQDCIKRFKWGKTRIFGKLRLLILLKSYSPPNMNIFCFFSMDELYYYLTRFCRKNFFMASLIRNVPKCWYWAFVISQFPDIMFHKVWSFMIEKFSNKF